MGKVVFDMSMSLDGFVKASNATPEQPLGEGGERLHARIWLIQASRYKDHAYHGILESTRLLATSGPFGLTFCGIVESCESYGKDTPWFRRRQGRAHRAAR
jgi:hypothetical protein